MTISTRMEIGFPRQFSNGQGPILMVMLTRCTPREFTRNFFRHFVMEIIGGVHNKKDSQCYGSESPFVLNTPNLEKLSHGVRRYLEVFPRGIVQITARSLGGKTGPYCISIRGFPFRNKSGPRPACDGYIKANKMPPEGCGKMKRAARHGISATAFFFCEDEGL